MKFQLALFLVVLVAGSIKADNEAALGDYPWHAYLWIYDGLQYSYCDGALIRTDYVLTAAHCIFGKDFVYARMGSVDLDLGSEWYSYVDGAQYFFTYADYSLANPSVNDVGMIYLYENAVLSPNVQPIALPLAGDTNLSGLQSVVTGFTSDASDPRMVLRHIGFPVMTDAWCQLMHEHRMNPNMICADTLDVFSPCFIDSGSPLHMTISGARRIVGVGAIWDEPCSSGHHGVFTRVTAHLPWINGVLNAPPPSPPPPPVEP